MNLTPDLVLIEWVDSAQPIPGWQWLSDFSDIEIVKCRSVGWLIHDGPDVKALAQSLGNCEDMESAQVSGIVRIPTRSVVRMEPISSCQSACSDPSLGLGSAQIRQES